MAVRESPEAVPRGRSAVLQETSPVLRFSTASLEEPLTWMSTVRGEQEKEAGAEGVSAESFEMLKVSQVFPLRSWKKQVACWCRSCCRRCQRHTETGCGKQWGGTLSQSLHTIGTDRRRSTAVSPCRAGIDASLYKARLGRLWQLRMLAKRAPTS
eukprot:17342_1